MEDKYLALKASVDTICVEMAEFQALALQFDHKSNQKKARLLSVSIDKKLKGFREISVAVGKIPER